jgi:hypothetical protein
MEELLEMKTLSQLKLVDIIMQRNYLAKEAENIEKKPETGKKKLETGIIASLHARAWGR